MAILQNTVTRLRIIVFSESHGAYHQRDSLDLSLWNLYLLVLWRKRRPFCKIQLNVSESSFSAGLMVVMIKTTFWSSYYSCQKLLHRTVKSPLKPIKTQKMANLENALRYIQIIFYSYSLPKQDFGALTVKFPLNLITTQNMANLQNTVTRLWVIVSSTSEFKILRMPEFKILTDFKTFVSQNLEL